MRQVGPRQVLPGVQDGGERNPVAHATVVGCARPVPHPRLENDVRVPGSGVICVACLGFHLLADGPSIGQGLPRKARKS